MAKRDWKAITLNYEQLEAYDDTVYHAYCLTQRQAAILKALLVTAYWSTRWDNLGESPAELEARMAEIDWRLDCCDCVSAGDIYYVTNLNLLYQIIYKTIYDGTTTSINIYAPTIYWSDDGSGDRLNALCMACMSLVGSICAQELQTLNFKMTGAIILFGVLFILTGGFLALGVIITGTLVAGVTYEAAKAALEDRDAQLAVACCMYNALIGQSITQPVFAASLDSCGFIGGTNEMICRDFVHRSIQFEETYLSMIDQCGKAYHQAHILGVNLCECGECGICTFDLPLSDLQYYVQYGRVASEGNPALCVHGEHWDNLPTFPYGARSEVTYELPSPITVNRVTFDTYQINAYQPGDLDRIIKLLDSAEVVLATWSETAVNPPKGEWFVSDISDMPVPLVKYVRIELVFVNSYGEPNEVRADNIRIFGDC